MATGLLILILVLLALVLMAVEVLIVPGFGISGIAAIISALVAEVLIFEEYGMLAAALSLAGFALLTVVLLVWVARSKTIDKVSLHSSIDSTNATKDQLSVKVGDEGVALTRLALIGNAEIAGKTVEVKSAGNFIEEGTPLVVVAVSEALVLVRERQA
jgi:membrane-bound ClpP family serine protease